MPEAELPMLDLVEREFRLLPGAWRVLPWWEKRALVEILKMRELVLDGAPGRDGDAGLEALGVAVRKV